MRNVPATINMHATAFTAGATAVVGTAGTIATITTIAPMGVVGGAVAGAGTGSGIIKTGG